MKWTQDFHPSVPTLLRLIFTQHCSGYPMSLSSCCKSLFVLNFTLPTLHFDSFIYHTQNCFRCPKQCVTAKCWTILRVHACYCYENYPLIICNEHRTFHPSSPTLISDLFVHNIALGPEQCFFLFCVKSLTQGWIKFIHIVIIMFVIDTTTSINYHTQWSQGMAILVLLAENVHHCCWGSCTKSYYRNFLEGLWSWAFWIPSFLIFKFDPSMDFHSCNFHGNLTCYGHHWSYGDMRLVFCYAKASFLWRQFSESYGHHRSHLSSCLLSQVGLQPIRENLW